MKKLKYLLLLLLVPILSGCYNYRELNDISIVTAVSIDYDEEEKIFKTITQVINPIKQQDASSSGEPPFVTYKSDAKSIEEARIKVIRDSPKEFYTSQMQILILSESIVNNHLAEVLDLFTRAPDIRSEFKIMVAQDNKALEGITIETIFDSLSSSNILDSLEAQSKKEGLTLDLTLNDLTSMYLNPYEEMAFPSLIVEGSINKGEKEENVTTTVAKATTKIGTTAIFKDNKLLGFLNEDESKVVSLIKGELTNTIINMDYKDGIVVLEPIRIKVGQKANLKDNTVTISIKGFARVDEIDANFNLKSLKEVENLEKYFNEYIEKYIEDNFEGIRKKYNSDIFGFRDLYYKTDHKYFKKYYDDWYEDAFPSLEIKAKSKIKLYEKGNTLGGILYERKNK